jgi:hypothetical protein
MPAAVGQFEATGEDSRPISVPQTTADVLAGKDVMETSIHSTVRFSIAFFCWMSHFESSRRLVKSQILVRGLNFFKNTFKTVNFQATDDSKMLPEEPVDESKYNAVTNFRPAGFRAKRLKSAERLRPVPGMWPLISADVINISHNRNFRR